MGRGVSGAIQKAIRQYPAHSLQSFPRFPCRHGLSGRVGKAAGWCLRREEAGLVVWRFGISLAQSLGLEHSLPTLGLLVIVSSFHRFRLKSHSYCSIRFYYPFPARPLVTGYQPGFVLSPSRLASLLFPLPLLTLWPHYLL